MFGSLGQDDIVGAPTSRPADAGRRPDGRRPVQRGRAPDRRNALGPARRLGVRRPADHGRDADAILGDNGTLYRLVAPAGGFLQFAYDQTADIGSDAANQNAPQPRAAVRVVPRSFQLLDYVPGSPDAGIGGSDLVKGEDGDDVIHGQKGNDVLYGDGWDDDIYGGVGTDKIFGGSGEDGIIADDGMIKTSRNGVAEPLYGMPPGR